MGDFGHRLKAFRQRLGREWTQERLGYEVGVSRNTISNWENGNYLPSREMVLRLAEKLLLSSHEIDQLLFEAQYVLEHQINDFEQGTLVQIAAARVEQMVVERFEVKSSLTLCQSAPRCDFYLHISLPPNYIKRTEVLAEVRTRLLGEASGLAHPLAEPYNRPKALHGMGGIGKSVVARVLCDDLAIQAAFPDGILWTTLGQAPEFLSKMREWINVLGGVIREQIPTVDGLKNTLAQLLKDRACLLILDDVWQRGQVETFSVAGPRSRLLFTTRDAEIAREVGAQVLPVPLMTELEARALLELWADGQLTNSDPDVKKQIARRLGYLPLAMKLAGAQLRQMVPDEWLHSFDISKLQARRIEGIHDSLTRTFELSLRELDAKTSHLYTALAIFAKDEVIPQVAVERLWQGLNGLDLGATAHLLDDLAARALLDIVHLPLSSSGKRAVQLHDLLHDLMSTALITDSRVIHHVLLDVYHQKCMGKGWHTANDDGYLYNHLAYHLHAAEAWDELKNLFADDQWLRGRVAQGDYTYDGYLGDLSLAWEYAEAEARQQIGMNQEPTALADCVRYLFIESSINSIAEKHVPELVVRAVETGKWTARRALDTASRIPSAKKRTQMYLALLQSGSLSSEQREEAQNLGLEAILDMPDEWWREMAIIDFSSQLPEEQQSLLDQALQKALAWEDEEEQAELLTNLALQLPKGWRGPFNEQEFIEQVLQKILALSDAPMRAKLVAKLAPQLSSERWESLFNQVWKDVQEPFKFFIWPPDASWQTIRAALKRELERYARAKFMEYEWVKGIKALASLIPQLPQNMHKRLLEEGLGKAMALEEIPFRAKALAALIPLLSGELLEQAQGAALAVAFGDWRTEVMAALASHLSSALLDSQLESSLMVEDQWERVEVYAFLSRYVTGEILTKLLAQGLEAVLASSDKWRKPKAHGSYFYEEKQQQILTNLAPQLTGKSLVQGLEIALALPYSGDREKPLAALATQLVKEPLDRVLQAVLPSLDDVRRADFLSALAPKLREEQIEYVIEAALALPTANYLYRKKVLLALVPQLSVEQRNVLLNHESKDAVTPTDRREQAYILAALIPQLPEEQRAYMVEQAMEAALTLTDIWVQADVLIALVPHLKGEQVERTLENALSILEEMKSSDTDAVSKRTDLLVALIPQLTEEQLRYVLEVIRGKLDSWQGTRVLVKIVPRLSGELRIKALEWGVEAASKPGKMPKWEIGGTLASLAPHLSGYLLEQAIEIALTLEETTTERWSRMEASQSRKESLLSQLRNGERSANEVQQELLALQRREFLKEGISSSASIKILATLASQLSDERRGSMLEEAFETALTLREDQGKGGALASLIPHISGQLLEQSLEAVLTLEDKAYRTYAISNIAPLLQGELLKQAVEIALRLEDAWDRTKALVSLLPFVEIQAPLIRSIQLAITDSLQSIQHWSRLDILTYCFNAHPLSPSNHDENIFTPPIFSPQMLDIIASHIFEICEEWHWL